MKILTSIIIPVFNEEKTIKPILDKVLEQKKYNKEIIVIDDCSSDKTKFLIENEYADKVKLISNNQITVKDTVLEKVSRSLMEI